MIINKSILLFKSVSGGTILVFITGEYLPCLNLAESTIYSISLILLNANNAKVLCPAPQIATFLFFFL
jgi:hypothetical protein